MLVAYGLGTTVGAGIYALVGEIAGVAGGLAPLSFLGAASVAGFTALSFGELAGRFPRSAGEAVYLREGLGSPTLATCGGLLVVLAGSTSAATVSLAALGYASEIVSIPTVVGLCVVVGLLAAVASWGIRESVWFAMVVTALEVAGVIVVTAVVGVDLAAAPDAPTWPRPEWSAATASGVITGSVLAFYAFLGFEDMVNVAEEVEDPRRNMRRGIVWTLIASTLLYVALAGVAVLAIDPAELQRSPAPVRLLYERAGGVAPGVISAIAIAGMLNGALIQIIMGSRVLYGLSRLGSLPRLLGRVHPRTRTPVVATVAVAVFVVVLAGFLPLVDLARATSVATLTLFALVNASLVALKRRGPPPPEVRACPPAVPVIGAILCALLVVREMWAFVAPVAPGG